MNQEGGWRRWNRKEDGGDELGRRMEKKDELGRCLKYKYLEERMDQDRKKHP